MAKAIKLYTGFTSYGKQVDVAQREDGVWFWREFYRNGRYSGMTPWSMMSEAPEHPSKVSYGVECADAPEYLEIPLEERTQRISWGFSTLSLESGKPRVRLP